MRSPGFSKFSFKYVNLRAAYFKGTVLEPGRGDKIFGVPAAKGGGGGGGGGNNNNRLWEWLNDTKSPERHKDVRVRERDAGAGGGGGRKGGGGSRREHDDGGGKLERGRPPSLDAGLRSMGKALSPAVGLYKLDP